MMHSRYTGWWILAGTGLASFLGAVDYTVNNTAVPAIQHAFTLNVNELQWVINSFILAISTMMAVGGRLSDLYNRKTVFCSGIACFCLASLLAGLTNHYLTLLIARFVQGIGAGIIFTSSAAIVSEAFLIEQREKIMGLFWGIMSLGLAVGPVCGGVIIAFASWRWIYLLNVPLGCIALTICLTVVPKPQPPKHKEKLDLIGTAVLFIAVSSLIVATVQGNFWGWSNKGIVTLFLLSLLSLCLFISLESKRRYPLIPMTLFQNNQFSAITLITFLLGTIYCLALFLIPLYLSNLRNFHGTELGLSLLPITVTMAVLSPLVGHWQARVGAKPLLILAFSFFFLFALFGYHFNTSTHYAFVFCTLVLLGAGWGMSGSPTTVVAINAAPRNNAGVAIGVIWSAQNIGAALGLALGSTLFNLSAIKALQHSAIIKNQPNQHNDSWFIQITKSPTHVITTLQHELNISKYKAISLYQQSFNAGYHHAMLLLVAVTILALVVVTRGLTR